MQIEVCLHCICDWLARLEHGNIDSSVFPFLAIIPHSLTHSLTPSLTHSLTHSHTQTHILTVSLTLSLPPSLTRHLPAALDECDPDVVVYNAGTDILVGDPLGNLDITPEVGHTHKNRNCIV